MARRFGLEDELGKAGKGLVSPESLKNQRMAENLCAQGRPKEAVPFMMKALEDQNNCDIFVTAAMIAPNLEASIETLDEGKRRGQATLRSIHGPKAFDDDGPLVPNFNNSFETRPYMRVMAAYVRIYVEYKKYSEAVDVIVEMFPLNPMDPLQQHTWLGSLLCFCKRYNDALYFAQVFLDIGCKRMALEDLPYGGGTIFLPPRSDLYTIEEQKKLKNYEATILYTAALASFKLRGDCEESRMYLKLAAGANPKVLVKVLGKLPKPEALNRSARTHNSQESAHDYLWLSHALWMDTDIWEWVNQNPDAKSTVLMKCGRDGCENRETRATQFKRCSGCTQISYCGPECQKADWKVHKPKCKEVQDVKKLQRSIAAGKPLPNGSMPVYMSDFTDRGIFTREAPVKKK